MTAPTLDATLRGEGVRSTWTEVPGTVRAATAELVGARVVAVDDRVGGFSPGPTAVITLSNGRRVFVKAADRNVNEGSAKIHLREARVAAWLPAEVPSPGLLGHVDTDGWVVLAFEAVEGSTPALPWRRDDLVETIAAHRRISEVVPDAAAPLRPATRTVGSLVGRWAGIAASPPPGIDAWSRRHAARLAEVESAAAEACAGDRLLHGDLRADNVLLPASGGAVVVDWPHASVGAAWIDLAIFAIPTQLQGGPTIDETLALASPSQRPPDDGALVALLAGVAGYFTTAALEPAPPGLPPQRRFQAAQGDVARRWLAACLSLR